MCPGGEMAGWMIIYFGTMETDTLFTNMSILLDYYRIRFAIGVKKCKSTLTTDA